MPGNESRSLVLLRRELTKVDAGLVHSEYIGGIYAGKLDEERENYAQLRKLQSGLLADIEALKALAHVSA